MKDKDKAKLEKAQEAWDQGAYYGSQPIHMDGGYECFYPPDDRRPEVKKSGGK